MAMIAATYKAADFMKKCTGTVQIRIKGARFMKVRLFLFRCILRIAFTVGGVGNVNIEIVGPHKDDLTEIQ